jgi:formylglycine-generating enzyme required for sulfatase activity
MALIQPGSFPMGSTAYFPFEAPVHEVRLRNPYYIAQRETTFDEWDACVKDRGCSYSPNDRGQGRGARPVTNVDWNDARQYAAWLSKKTGKHYRLPTEAEWGYAARGGASTIYPWGSKMEKGRANCSGCDTPHSTQAVPTGSFPPNGYGLFDMAGNAAEWVEDCWNDSYHGAPSDGSAWTRAQCQERVLRGGSFNNDPRYLRSAARFKYDFDVRYYTNGFRVARAAP